MSSVSPPRYFVWKQRCVFQRWSRAVCRCVFGKCHCTHGSMNNLPNEKVFSSINLPILSFSALNSEMGAICPVVSEDVFGDITFLPPGTVTMSTYSGSISPAGSFYGKGALVLPLLHK